MNDTRTSLLRRLGDLSDQHSWSEFVHLYEPLLLAYVLKQGLDRADAEDVVQGIFIALVRRLPTFQLDRARGRFRTWLYRLARNAVIDWERTRGRHHRLAQHARQNFDEAAPEPDADWEAMHRQRLLSFVMEKVKEQTNPNTWACFEQHSLHGKPAAEVAQSLGIPTGTVYVYASRVLGRIRAQCALYEEEFGDA